MIRVIALYLRIIMSNNKVAILSLSGGMDSTSLMLHLLQKKYSVHAISFIYGQKHQVEINLAKNNILYLKRNGFNKMLNHKVFDLSNIFLDLKSSLLDDEKVPEGHYESKSMLSTFVPNRNAIFFSILFAHAISLAKKGDSEIKISMGAHGGDHAIYPDCRDDFFIDLFNVSKKGNWDSDNISLYMPYIKMNKSDILEDSIKNIDKMNLDFNKIYKNTITSYSPDIGGISSGKTGSDIERILAFNKLNLIDPIKYQETWDIVLKNAKKIEEEYNNKK